MRLVSEGFVEATPQRRYCVARPSARRVHEAFELRLLTESYALPSAVNSARQAPARWVRLLDRSKELLKRGVEGKDDAVRATMLDEALHKAIVASARNNRLLQVWQRERDVTSMAYALSTRQAFGLDDHVALLSAIIGGDGQSARTTLAKHLREASRNMTVEEQAPYDTRRGGQE